MIQKEKSKTARWAKIKNVLITLAIAGGMLLVGGIAGGTFPY
jgi:hypothetical protein